MIQTVFFWMLLAVSPAIFWVLPRPARYYVLAVASLVLIAYLDPKSALLLAALAVLLYLAFPILARTDRSATIALAGCLTILIGVIAYQKYLPLILANLTSASVGAADIVVPLGMSFYIFKMIHVAVDAYRRKTPAPPPGLFFCYLFLFTTFSAGPIQRLDLFLEGLEDRFRTDFLVDGLTRIAFGFVKQFFIVDLVILELRHRLVAGADEPTAFVDNLALDRVDLWLKLIIVYLIGYLNFSAYTDIAIGASRLFGFRISENFNFPIVARSIGEFWQRWHMTLAAWCQSYVYSPVLGLTRNPYVALYASFLVIGIWHAGTLNRAAWGLFHASAILVAARWRKFARRRGFDLGATKPGQALGWLLTQGFVTTSMVFVIGEFDNDIGTSVRLLLRLFGLDFWLP